MRFNIQFWAFFYGLQRIFLTPWSLNFAPNLEISSTPIWLCLPHLPLFLWTENTLKGIQNELGLYLAREKPKEDLYSCARICIEVELDKGLLESIQLELEGWTHFQGLDYGQLPFKYSASHFHGNFTKNYQKQKEKHFVPKQTESKDLEFKIVSKRQRKP